MDVRLAESIADALREAIEMGDTEYARGTGIAEAFADFAVLDGMVRGSGALRARAGGDNSRRRGDPRHDGGAPEQNSGRVFRFGGTRANSPRPRFCRCDATVFA